MENKPRSLNAAFNKILNKPISEADFKYALKYGIFSAVLLLIKKTVTFIFFGNAYISNKPLYLANISLMAIFLILLIVIKFKKMDKSKLYPRIILFLYPFVIIILTSVSAFLNSNFPNFIFSYMVLLIIVSWVQIYNMRKRIILYSFALILINVLNIHINGFTEIGFEYFAISLMSIIVSYIASSNHYVIYSNQRLAIKDLDIRNKTINKTINLVKKSHEELKTSKKITDTMLSITQEVLKNEDIEDVLQLVLEEAVKLIPNAQAGSILINNGSNMKYVAAKGYSLEKLKKVKLRYEDLFQASLDDVYEPTIIRNLETFDEIQMGETKTKKLKHETTQLAKSCLTCSFRYNDEFFGSINIDNFESEEIFITDDKYLIKQLAKEIEIIVSIHKLYEQALRPTKYDDLTDVYTRKYCMKLLSDLIDENVNDEVAICTIDINRLKSINDKLGHDAGDKYLVYFADAVRTSIKGEFIFGRVGGDEFLLIFSKLNMKTVLQKIEKIRDYLKEKIFKTEDFKGEITFASGISMYAKDGKNIFDLIKLSDKRMYENKNSQKIK